MSPNEVNTGLEVPAVVASPAEIGHVAADAAAATNPNLVQVPQAVVEQNAATAAANEAAAAEASEVAAQVAAEIAATAPEMPAVDTAPSSRPATPEEAASVTATTPLYRPEAQLSQPQPVAQEAVTPQQ